jgi:hypothetical protein
MEFQGDFEYSEDGDVNDLDLGMLKDLGKGNYELQVGNHSIKGKITDLAKPLLMTEKVSLTDGNVNFMIKAIIRKKVIFSTRPTPLRKNLVGDNDSKRRKVN